MLSRFPKISCRNCGVPLGECSGLYAEFRVRKALWLSKIWAISDASFQDGCIESRTWKINLLVSRTDFSQFSLRVSNLQI